MAAPLTWRNVDAPDFRGSMVGLGIAGQSIDRAFSGLSAGIDKFDVGRKENAASEVLNNAMAFQDPQALRAAMADGSLFSGVNRGLLTPAALGALDNKAGLLLNQATSQQALDTNRVLDPLKIDDQRLRNTRTGIDNDYQVKSEPTRLAQLGATLDSTRAQTDGTRAQTEGTQANTNQTRANTDQTVQRTAQQGTTFGWQVADRADEEAAKPALARLQDGSMNAGDAREFFGSQEFKDMSPGVQQRLRNWANTEYRVFGAPATAAIAGAAGSGGGASAPGTAGTRAGSIGDVTFNYTRTQTPVTEMPIGDVLNYQKTDLLPSQGASPVGAFQINHATLTDFAPRVLGEDWRSQTLTLANQDKIAEAIFNARKGGNLSETWRALPDKGVGGYADLTWEQVRTQIAKTETDKGGTLPTIQELRGQVVGSNVQAQRAVGQIGARAAQDTANTITPAYQAAMQDRSSLGEVADRMIKTGSYQGMDRGRAIRELQLLTEKQGITPAVAELILQNNVETWRGMGTWVPGPDIVPNRANAERDAALVQRGTTFDSAQQLGAMGATAAGLESARSLHETAATQLAQAIERKLPAERISFYRSQLALAKAALEGKLGRQQGDSTLQPRFDRQAPPPETTPNPFETPAPSTRRFPSR